MHSFNYFLRPIKTVNDIPVAEKECAFYKPKRRVENETISLPDLAERRKIRETKDCSLGYSLSQPLIDYPPIVQIDLKGNIIKED